MYFIKGVITSKNIVNGVSKNQKEFKRYEIQLLGKTSSGKAQLETVLCSKDKVDKFNELKEGAEVTLPVSVIVKNGYKNIYLQ